MLSDCVLLRAPALGPLLSGDSSTEHKAGLGIRTFDWVLEFWPTFAIWIWQNGIQGEVTKGAHGSQRRGRLAVTEMSNSSLLSSTEPFQHRFCSFRFPMSLPHGHNRESNIVQRDPVYMNTTVGSFRSVSNTLFEDPWQGVGKIIYQVKDYSFKRHLILDNTMI